MDAESTDGSTSAIAGSDPSGPPARRAQQGILGEQQPRHRARRARRSCCCSIPMRCSGEVRWRRCSRARSAIPRAGIIGPTVLNPDGSAQAYAWGRFPSLWSFLWLRLWRFAKRVRGNRQLSPKHPDAHHSRSTG